MNVAALPPTLPVTDTATAVPGPQPAALHGFGEVLARALKPLASAQEAAVEVPAEDVGVDLADVEAPDRGARMASLALASRDPREPHVVHRSTELLVPELRTRLDRIVERMRDEYGHEVRVVETYRSTERQATLYAQGRTTAGPTVTWTRESQHMHGRAVDVIIDEDYGHAVAYERLARIATEEGVRTLGARDPGHLELAGTRSRSDAVTASTLTSASRPNTSGATGVAGVAQVAQVANVAQVASVAHVARPGSFGPARTAQTQLAGGNTPAPPSQEQSERRTRIPEHTADAVEQDALQFMAAAELAGTPLQGEQSPAVAATSGNDFAARVARVLALQDSAQTAPTSGVTLLVENAEGTAARIRLGLRGGAVGTTIDMSDAVAARELEARIDELRRGLERQGLDAGTLLVRAATPAREQVETMRVTVPTAAELLPSTGKQAESQNTHDRSPGSPRRDTDSSDQRQKRQGKENPS